MLLGLGLAVEDDIENRKTHHDDELDHEHDDFDSFVIDIPSIANPGRSGAARRRGGRGGKRAARERASSRSAASRCGCCVQAVGPRVNHYYDRAWTADDDRRSRLVVIGLKGLNRPAIEKILAG